MRGTGVRQPLKDWLDTRIQDVIDGKVPNPEATFVHYWVANGGLGENFRRKDVVFECFHNFLAFSQWGNTLYNVMARLQAVNGDPQARASFQATMANGPDEPDEARSRRSTDWRWSCFGRSRPIRPASPAWRSSKASWAKAIA